MLAEVLEQPRHPLRVVLVERGLGSGGVRVRVRVRVRIRVRVRVMSTVSLACYYYYDDDDPVLTYPSVRSAMSARLPITLRTVHVDLVHGRYRGDRGDIVEI